MSTGNRRAAATDVQTMRPIPEVVWHDLEVGSHSADLGFWEQLSAEVSGEILEIGCGAGRVSLHLAKGGHPMVGIERRPVLVAAFNRRAKAEGVPAQAIVTDVREFQLRRGFNLALAPMQVMQQLGDTQDRVVALRAIRAHLERNGVLAAAIVEPEALDPPSEADSPAAEDERLPEVREIHGWVFSSRLTGARITQRGLLLERLRERVSPRGEILKEHHSENLAVIDAAAFEEEARVAGLHPRGRHRIDFGEWHAASTVVLLERRRR